MFDLPTLHRELQGFVKQSIAVVTDGDGIGEIHDGRGRVQTGFLFFRWHQIDLRNCSYFLVRREDLFGSFWATRVVVRSDYRWSFWLTTLFSFDYFLILF